MRKWGLTIEYSLCNIIRQYGEPGGSEYREVECETYQEAETLLNEFAKECEDSLMKQNIPFFRTLYKYQLIIEKPYDQDSIKNIFDSNLSRAELEKLNPLL